MKRWRKHLGLALAVLGYAVAAYLVFTRQGAVLGNDDRVTIRIAHWQIEAGPPEAMDALIKRYEELNPHINVEQVAVPGNVYKQWLRTQLIGGSSAAALHWLSRVHPGEALTRHATAAATMRVWSCSMARSSCPTRWS